MSDKQVIKPCPDCKQEKDWMTFIWKDGTCRCPECHNRREERRAHKTRSFGVLYGSTQESMEQYLRGETK